MMSYDDEIRGLWWV